MVVFEEEKIIIAYCPSFDLNGYGNTEAEAIESIKFVVKEYVDYGLNKGTLLEDLKLHGWKIKSKRSKNYIAPDWESLLRDNEDFSEIINHKDFKKIHIPVEIASMV